jgi:hypothetical protein
MEDPIVPSISSSVSGPLGVLHLPRVWLKILLHAADRLPEGYRHGTGGMDEMLCANLGIDRDAFVSFVEKSKPTYLEVEAWVRANAANLNQQSIARHNEAVLTREMPEPMRAERRAEVGLTDTSITKAVALNDLDDWTAAHRQITQNSN